MTPRDDAAAVFEQHRRALTGLAYRMSGSLEDARDIVQECYLKWHAAEVAGIEDPRAWLMTVCSRLALNLATSARKRREQYVGSWLPEPFLEDDAPGPVQRAQVDETVSIALMLALEKLSPAERAAFLLHDVFDCPFEEIARVLGRSPEATRKLASRARATVRQERPRFAVSADEHARLLTAFLSAARAGDVGALHRVLASDVAMHTDSGGKVEALRDVLVGAQAVADFLSGVFRKLAADGARLGLDAIWFNGGPGLLLRIDGRPATAFGAQISDGRISALYALRNPDKLRALDRRTDEKAATPGPPQRSGP